jgi:6-phosphogluconolactonase (cycloisomerase 2 family)
MNRHGLRFRSRLFSAALLAGAVAASGVSHAAQYTFSQGGFQDGGVITGAFTGEDANGDGLLASFDGEISDFNLSFNGNSIIPAFSQTFESLGGLVFQIGKTTLGDGGTPGSDYAEGMAVNWLPDGLDPVEFGLTGYSFVTGIGPLGEARGEIGDWDTGAKLLTTETMTVSAATSVPEPASWMLMGLGMVGLGLLSRRSKRAAGALAGVAMLASGAANAQTAVIWQQGFANGLGQFTPAGTVTAAADGAHLVGSAWSIDGTVTSGKLSTLGFTNVSLSYDRSCVAGLDTTEGVIAEYAINGGSYTRLEMSRDVSVARASYALPAEAANAALTVRFRINSNSSNESCTVNNVSLAGQAGTVSSNRPAIGKFVTFESGQVRPLALSADGQRLYAVNTPDSRLEIFIVTGTKPVLLQSVPVGMEPVAVAVAPDGKLWVVNHLSDSISIVDVSVMPARVVNTLLVGDEPRDIVFAGPGNKWAFITAAHRGQNIKFDPKLTTPGIGRADVWVFNATSPGAALGGTPVGVLNMFGDTLRALARNADGSRVYAAVFNSGNKTTVLEEDLNSGGFGADKAPPYTAADGSTAPQTGLIVQKNADGDWVDSGDPKSGTPPKKWNNRVRIDLPDYDVFTIDTTGAAPVVVGKTSGVGTTLFNMAVNPTSGKLYVSNQEAMNLNRFEGPGTRSTTVRGHFVESRITVIDGANVLPRHLNKHITSYGSNLGTPAEKAAALATPLQMAVTSDGSKLYMVAMGSDKIARFGTAALEANTFTPSATDQLVLSGGGPTGLVLDQAHRRAFVMTRFDNGISVVNTDVFAEAAHVRMFNPEPAEVVSGRRFLYDAKLTSSRGDSSCAGCHIFGDMDQLSWDLGNPDGVRVMSPNAYSPNVPTTLRRTQLHPMKGPMSTQSLRGLVGNGPMHWRGDRFGVTDRALGETLEERAFRDFNVAFTSLLGRDSSLTDAQMTAFAKYAMNLSYPPNPNANLDNTLTAVQAAGLNVYNKTKATGLGTCNSCHVLDATSGKFGTAGLMSFEGLQVEEDFKIPQLRNVYQKVGMFGHNVDLTTSPNVGEQIRGFGFDKSGTSGTIFQFLKADVFTLTDTQRTQVEQLVLAMPSNLNPVVGQQVTVTAANVQQADITGRVNLLAQRAAVTSPRPECELIAKGVIGSEARGWVMNSTSSFVPDRASESPVTLAGLLSQITDAGSAVTFTCVPPGNGTRMGIDRDANTVLDRN